MRLRTTTRCTTIALLTTAILLSAGSVSASKQAIVEVVLKNQFFGGTTFTKRSATWSKSGSVLVTVDTPAATPSIMWPANILSGGTSFTYVPAYGTFGSLMSSYMFKAGTIEKSHAGAAPSGGSILLPAAATNICFVSNPPYVIPGPPALTNQCFPRYGSGMRTPGAKNFGGTARLLRNTDLIAVFSGYPSGLSLFSLRQFYSSALTGPSAVGENGVVASGPGTNTIINLPILNQGHQTAAPFTTGVATVMGGAYYTQLTLNGSHNFNTANLTGMISMVKPVLSQGFLRDSVGTFIGTRGASLKSIRTFSITFAGEVPEPATAVLLGFGALGLTGLAALRRR